MLKNLNIPLCRVLSLKYVIRSLSGAFNCLSSRALEKSLRKCVHVLKWYKVLPGPHCVLSLNSETEISPWSGVVLSSFL